MREGETGDKSWGTFLKHMLCQRMTCHTEVMNLIFHTTETYRCLKREGWSREKQRQRIQLGSSGNYPGKTRK